MRTIVCRGCSITFTAPARANRRQFCTLRCSSKHYRRCRGPEYYVWIGVKTRCLNKKEAGYKHYGGRGILICDRWKDSFDNFLHDMGKRPSPKHSIERLDVNGNYEPGNCVWATKSQQVLNTRANKRYTHDGITLTIIEWENRVGLSRNSLRVRVERGWSFEDAIRIPTGGKRPGVKRKKGKVLTRDEVRAIRSATGTIKTISDIFGVSQSCVQSIRAGRTWKDV